MFDCKDDSEKLQASRLRIIRGNFETKIQIENGGCEKYSRGGKLIGKKRRNGATYLYPCLFWTRP